MSDPRGRLRRDSWRRMGGGPARAREPVPEASRATGSPGSIPRGLYRNRPPNAGTGRYKKAAWFPSPWSVRARSTQMAPDVNELIM